MPIYEYRCSDCGKRTQILTLSIKSPVEAKCRHCGGANMEKLVSRVAVRRSEGSRLESLADPSSLSGLDENDPKSVARWMKKMGKEMGEDVGEDFDQIADEAAQEVASGRADGEDESGGPGSSEDL